MSTILDEIAEYTRARIEAEKIVVSPAEMQKMAEDCSVRPAIQNAVDKEGSSQANVDPDIQFAFEKKLAAPGMSFICECKKSSPSKGVIAEDFPYLDIAKAYEAAGAAAVSVLTEPNWFMGSDRYLEEITGSVSIPCLRKDFTIDSYMIYQAKVLGASAVLLIVSLLDPAELRDYIDIADSLGLSALVEAHNKAEVETALRCGARVIGVNNRNLHDFSVNTDNAASLRKLVPDDVLFVAESGIKTREDVKKMEHIGADAVLVGETLMRAPDKAAKLRELAGAK